MFLRWLIFLTLIVDMEVFSLSPPPGKPSDWDNWTFAQKILWRGLNLDPRIPYGPLADKLRVKEIVQADMPTAKTLFATNDPSQILISKLPDSFIMKANNASGRGVLVKNGMVMATKKREANFVPKKCTNNFLRKYAKKWLSDLYKKNKEKQYGLIKPMILFEEYLEDITLDIELYFFNGKARVITLFFNEEYTKKPAVSYYDENWNLFDISHPKFLVKKELIEKPHYIENLIAFGERFAEKIDHVRIDFFVNNKNVYFGEFTFTTGGGHSLDHLNEMIGSYWDYPDPNDPFINPYVNELLQRAEQREGAVGFDNYFGL